MKLMLFVTMVRKADRLGFYQVVQCRPRWVYSDQNTQYVCGVYCYYVCFIVWRFRDSEAKVAFFFLAAQLWRLAGEQLVAGYS